VGEKERPRRGTTAVETKGKASIAQSGCPSQSSQRKERGSTRHDKGSQKVSKEERSGVENNARDLELSIGKGKEKKGKRKKAVNVIHMPEKEKRAGTIQDWVSSYQEPKRETEKRRKNGRSGQPTL